MTNIILIDKTGTIKQATVKGLAKDLSNLYKKCGCKNPDEFDKCGSWNVNIDTENVYVEMWARDNGRANMENKYDFPPPCDTTLYFGTCALVRLSKNGDILNLTETMWKKIYEKLFGGFDDIEEEEDDDDDEDELANVPKEMKTKGGYLKDGFVVDNVEEEDGDENDDEDNEGSVEETSDETDEEENENMVIELDDSDDNDYSGSELEEEEYEYSDED